MAIFAHISYYGLRIIGHILLVSYDSSSMARPALRQKAVAMRHCVILPDMYGPTQWQRVGFEGLGLDGKDLCDE